FERRKSVLQQMTIPSETLQVRAVAPIGYDLVMHSSARSTLISGALVASIPVMLVTVSASTDREWTLTIEPVTSPAAKESSAPQLTTADRTILSWMERAGSQATLKMSERTPTGG